MVSQIKFKSELKINILLPNKICFIPSVIVSKPTIRLNLLKLTSAICNLLFSKLIKVKRSSINK